MTNCLRLAPFLFLLTLFGFGCTHSYKHPSGSPEALRIVSEISRQNAGLDTFKGTAGIRLTTPDESNRFRLAWAGKSPDQLRMTILFSGRPVETLATDGKSFCLKSHTGQHKLIRQRSGDINLKRLISIPVQMSDLIRLLAGGIPVEKHTVAELRPAEEGEKAHRILELKRPFKGIVQRFYLTETSRVSAFETLSGKTVRYRVDLDAVRDISGFSIPFTIRITTQTAEADIRLNRYWPNADTSTVSFTIDS